MFKLGNVSGEGVVVGHFNALLEALNEATLDRHHTRDFSRIFERYILNNGPGGMGAPPPLPL